MSAEESESKGHLLVVDDNEMNRELLERRLGRRGYTVRAVEDGHQALEALNQGPCDLMILDIMMPGLSGLDVLRALRQDYTPSALPVIMATAKTDTEDVVEAMKLGATDYVTKPINLPVLLARIEAQLSMKQDTPSAPLGRRLSSSGSSRVRSDSLRPGDLLDDRYELDAQIGSGGFSLVYRAHQVSTGQAVAVKLLRPELLASCPDPATEQERFQLEMQVIGRLRHPNIVRLIDCGVLADGHLYTVLELVDGQTLADMIRTRGPLPPREAQHLMLQVLDALSVAHGQQVIHLDLKPQNIMVVSTGVRSSAMVLDFGLAAIAQPGERVPGELRGTPSYMAPEYLRRQGLTPQADIYAWGLVLLECLTGRVAVHGGSKGATVLDQLSDQPVTIPPEIRHKGLRELITRATAKSPALRYATAQQAHADLEAMQLDSVPFLSPVAADPLRAPTRSQLGVEGAYEVSSDELTQPLRGETTQAPPDADEVTPGGTTAWLEED